LHQPYWP